MKPLQQLHASFFTTASAIFLLLSAFLRAEAVELLETTTVEEEALSFAEGPAARFGLTANGRSHQQTPITSYRGYQYATYFDAERKVCIARRSLPKGSWEVISFPDHRFATNDSHNTAVLGICDKDGTIHMAFDHHASRLNYRVSKKGAAHNPETVDWTASLFGKIEHTLGSVEAAKSVTYPRFFSAPNGNLMLYYRAVTSGNGDGMIEEYDGDKHDWTPGLGKFIARDIGNFTDGDAISQYRCPYMNALSYAGSRLHASWVWRDRFEKTMAHNQHDLCYAYSDDNGRTWQNSAGNTIGETGRKFIHLNTKGLVVAEIPIHHGLSNQTTHFAYPDGSVHVMVLHNREGLRGRYIHHYWRSSKGDWEGKALPFCGTRPKLLGGPDHSLVLVYADDEQLHLAKGSPNSAKTAWQWERLELSSPQSTEAEPLPDAERWAVEGVLSIYLQEKPAKKIRTKSAEPIDGMPSALKVLDYRLTTPSSSVR